MADRSDPVRVSPSSARMRSVRHFSSWREAEVSAAAGDGSGTVPGEALLAPFAVSLDVRSLAAAGARSRGGRGSVASRERAGGAARVLGASRGAVAGVDADAGSLPAADGVVVAAGGEGSDGATGAAVTDEGAAGEVVIGDPGNVAAGDVVDGDVVAGAAVAVAGPAVTGAVVSGVGATTAGVTGVMAAGDSGDALVAASSTLVVRQPAYASAIATTSAETIAIGTRERPRSGAPGDGTRNGATVGSPAGPSGAPIAS